MEVSVRAGFIHILLHEPKQAELEAVHQYLRSLQPEPSPYRKPSGKLSARAQRGKRLFESDRTGCSECHPAPLYTDLQARNVGTRGPFDRADKLDTPTLFELHRTGPYLHDGSATILMDVLTTFNRTDNHGRSSHLTPEELKDLEEYLKSL